MPNRTPAFAIDRLRRTQTQQGDEIATLREQLHGQSGLQAQLTAAKLDSGLYTPTVSGGTNVASSSSIFGQYLRVGNIVHFSVQLGITPTAGATLTSFLLTLPVASALALNSDAIGDGSAAGATIVPALVRGNLASDGLFISFTPSSNIAQGVRIVGSYQVI